MKTVQSNSLRIVLVIAVSLLYFNGGQTGLFLSVRDFFLHYFPSLVSDALTYLVRLAPVLAVLWFMHGCRGFWNSVGLNRGFVKGILLAFLFTFPMFIGKGIIGHSLPEYLSWYIVLGVIASGVFNEFFYRGFTFGQLFRYCGLGFFPSVLISVFPIGLSSYLYGNDLLLSLGVYVNVVLVALFYGWVYIEWNYNLWITIGLNIFMAGTSMLSAGGILTEGALWSNVSYFLTLVLVVGYTVYYKYKHNMPYFITPKNMWINHTACKSNV